jgi:hypothetical protein
MSRVTVESIVRRDEIHLPDGIGLSDVHRWGKVHLQREELPYTLCGRVDTQRLASRRVHEHNLCRKCRAELERRYG